MVISAPREKVGGQIFNVGSEDQNYEMGTLAKEIINAIGKDSEIELSNTNDYRSYFASFKKIREVLGFVPKLSIKDGVQEIYQELENGTLKDSIETRTMEWYKKLLSDNNLAQKYALNGIIL